MIDTLQYRTAEGVTSNLSCSEIDTARASFAKEAGLKTLRVRKSDSGIVRFSFSVPEVLYGSSVQEYRPADMERLVAFMAKLTKKMGVDPEEMMEFVISRIDLCKNMIMPSAPSLYVAQFARYPKPSRWSRPVFIPPTQAGFRKNAHHWLGCYDKGRKNRKIAPKNMLRWELQLSSTKEIRKMLGIATISDLINLSPERVINLLMSEFLLVVGQPVDASHPTPDLEALWSAAKSKGERKAAPAFAINYLLQVGTFEPQALSILTSFLRENLGQNFRHFNDTYLKNCNRGNFDERFNEEVLGRFEVGWSTN